MNEKLHVPIKNKISDVCNMSKIFSRELKVNFNLKRGQAFFNVWSNYISRQPHTYLVCKINKIETFFYNTVVSRVMNKTAHEHNLRTSFVSTSLRKHKHGISAAMFHHCCITCIQMCKNIRITYTLKIVSLCEHFRLTNKVKERIIFVTRGTTVFLNFYNTIVFVRLFLKLFLANTVSQIFGIIEFFINKKIRNKKKYFISLVK